MSIRRRSGEFGGNLEVSGRGRKRSGEMVRECSYYMRARALLPPLDRHGERRGWSTLSLAVDEVARCRLACGVENSMSELCGWVPQSYLAFLLFFTHRGLALD